MNHKCLFLFLFFSALTTLTIAQNDNFKDANCCDRAHGRSPEKLNKKVVKDEFFLINEVDYLPKNFCGRDGWPIAPSGKVCHNTFEEYFSKCMYHRDDFKTLDHQIIEISNYVFGDHGIRASSIPEDPCVQIKVKINNEGNVEEAKIVTHELPLKRSLSINNVVLLKRLNETLDLIKGAKCNPALYKDSKVNIELNYMIIFRENEHLQSTKYLSN